MLAAAELDPVGEEVAGDGLPTLLRMLEGEPLEHVAAQLTDGDLTCFRLACASFRAHSAPPSKKFRTSFMRSATLVRFAWEQLPAFRDAEGADFMARAFGTAPLLLLAAGVGSVDAIAWLHSAGCGLSDAATCRAAGNGHLEALRRMFEHGCPWIEA